MEAVKSEKILKDSETKDSKGSREDIPRRKSSVDKKGLEMRNVRGTNSAHLRMSGGHQPTKAGMPK
jgi:hypothetical protein